MAWRFYDQPSPGSSALSSRPDLWTNLGGIDDPVAQGRLYTGVADIVARLGGVSCVAQHGSDHGAAALVRPPSDAFRGDGIDGLVDRRAMHPGEHAAGGSRWHRAQQPHRLLAEFEVGPAVGLAEQDL